MAELPQTTAEDLLRASEAVDVLGPEVHTDDVAIFIGGSNSRAKKALTAARDLEFVDQGADADQWNGNAAGRALSQADQAQKTVLLRYQLESYEPFTLFRNRIVAGETPENAARQVSLACNLTTDQHEIERTLKDWGTYSRGLIYAEDQSLLAAVDAQLFQEVLDIRKTVLDERAAVQAHVIDELGPDAAGFATGECLDKLVDGYFDLVRGQPADQSIFQLGKGLETFLKALSDRDPPLNVPGNVRTMGQHAHFLKTQGRLKEKHFQVVMGIVGIRNAADHAGDPEIGNSPWAVSKAAAFAAHHLTWAFMRSWFAAEEGNYEL